MGCGHNKVTGYVNVDLSPECAPDLVFDLESVPWPWEDNSIDAVRFNHSLEHLGESSRTFLDMMRELYRVCKNNAEVEINVPHPRHDDFLNDPTHVRVITPALLTLFDRQLNDKWKREGVSNSPLAHYLNVDFSLTRVQIVLSEPYFTQYKERTITDENVAAMMRDINNVVSEYRMVMTARKP
jgi:predicted SAM-dependent methyltransferase